MTPLEALANGAAAILGRSLTSEERDDFSKYLGLLVKWQRAHRLVGSACASIRARWLVSRKS